MRRQMGANEQRLARELEKLKEFERCDIRMIETAKQRFRIRHRKLSSALRNSKDAHGSSESLPEEISPSVEKFHNENFYKTVRSMIFTDDEVDPDKIICLHLLTVHAVDMGNHKSILSKSSINKERIEKSENHLNDGWNDILPCYVVEIQRNELEFHESQEQQVNDNSVLHYRRLTESSEDLYSTSQTPRSRIKRKISIFPPRLYNTEGKINRANQSSAQLENPVKNRRDIKVEKSYVYFHSSFPLSGIHDNSDNSYRRIVICVNEELSNLIRAVWNALQNANPEKATFISNILKNKREIRNRTSHQKTQSFINWLMELKLISSPNNFIFIPSLAIETNEFHSKYKLKREIIAETLQIIPTPDFDLLLTEIRNNIDIFLSDEKAKVSSSESNISVREKIKYIHDINSFSKTSEDRNHLIINNNDSSNSQEVSKSIITKDTNETKKSSSAKNIFYIDPDRVILRRMTHAQRVLVGQLCASLKTKKINNEGASKERIPLISLMKSALSQESLIRLTEGTVYAKDNKTDQTENLKKERQIDHTELNSSIISKIHHEIADLETKRKLDYFIKKCSTS